MTPLRRRTVEAILRDIARDIRWLTERAKREGENSGWNRDQVAKLEAQAARLKAEIAGA